MYGKKSGDVDISEYSQDGFVQKFEVLSRHLQEKFGKEKIFSAKNLSLFTGQLTKYMEKHAGRDSKRPCPFTRIPAEILRDFSMDGPLSLILSTCFDFRRRKGLKTIDFTDQNRVPQLNKMFQNCLRALKKRGYLGERIIFLTPALSEHQKYDFNQLKEIVERLDGAKLAENKEESTHIIYPDQYFEDNDEDYLRTLVVDKEREVAFVHWWYYPSSYDEWVPLKMVQGEPEPKKEPPEKWEIGARWLLDTDKFNEWIPEADYEIEEDFEEEQPQIRVQVQTRAAEVESMQIEETKKPEAQQVQENQHDKQVKAAAKRILPHIDDDEITDDDDEIQKNAKKKPNRKRQRQDEGKKSSKRMKSDPNVEDIEIPQAFSRPDGSTQTTTATGFEVPHEVAPGVIDLQPQAAELDDIPYTGPVLTRVSVRRPLYPVVVPSYVNWFNQGQIHRIEWEEFGDILKGSAFRQELYVKVRDTIVNTFRLNPRIHLSCAACRRFVCADSGLVFRIHKFLERWNLINYFVDEGAIPPLTRKQQLELIQQQKQNAASNLSYPQNTQPQQKKNSPPKPKTKRPELDLLSSSSFCGGGLGTSYNEDNSEEQTEEKAKESLWGEEQTSKLIEGLSMFGDDWNEIAEHVGGTADECINRFVELPLDDPEIQLHNDIPSDNVNVFADGSNPIMRQAAFIASLVSPDVAAVSAKAALHYMRNNKKYTNPLKKTTHEWKVNDRCFTKFGEGAITKVENNKIGVQLSFGEITLNAQEVDTIFDFDENTEIDGDDETEKLRSLAAGSLGASSTNAIKLASKKEKNLHDLMQKLIFMEIEKIRIKTDQLDDLWKTLCAERKDIQFSRQLLLKERIELSQHLLKVQRLLQGQNQRRNVVPNALRS